MIAKLKGKIDELKPAELILDVHGVGYHVLIPFTTYDKIQGKQEIELYIYTLHKEDQFRLFGFSSENEKQLFSILLNISGIGPSMALSILSGMAVDLLVDAVQNSNSQLLTKIPGIGKSKAEKLIFELKRKIKKLETFTSSGNHQPSIRNDAVEALASLGFDESAALKSVNDIINKFPDIPIEELIKNALKNLSS
ncbi:MAG: Holliday junction branch migration protein RuvA [Spirochaetes bacterium]|nr:Holliday junction branch migration protein RuvA [Spirochaetota bacterium]